MKTKIGFLSLKKGVTVVVDRSIVKLSSNGTTTNKSHGDLVSEMKYPNELEERVNFHHSNSQLTNHTKR